ncbi:MAG: hypothetical protein J9259_04870 [Thermoplasmata archaeon YP2-bin.285]|uniref:Uncharacterized protein n=1 Tax=Candidatus Sysuiplasma superficiale TaxID=2823368 RepID=A0A8J7YNB6_9ARCH|nr:hypothetical protein [Candidatus Sysuiplasma superficiale]
MKAKDLENDPRLARILRTKSALFGMEEAALVIIAVFLLLLNGFSLRPPLFPIYNVVLIFFFFLLVMSVERIFFFRLSMRYGRRKGVMYLIARRVMRYSVAILVLSIVASALLFAVNFMPVFNQQGTVSGPVGTASFQSGNFLALYSVGSVTVSNPTGSNLTFVIVTQGDYLASGATPQAANESLLIYSNLAGGNDFVPAGGSTTVHIVTLPDAVYYIVVFSGSGNVQAHYILQMKASPSIFDAFLLSCGMIPVSAYLAVVSKANMSFLRSETIFK